MRILALCGSPRPRSYNRALLEAARALAPSGTSFHVADDLATLPHFHPDRDDLRQTPPLKTLDEAVRAADVILIASPEYVHGIPGTLKNALDWLVGSGVCDQKLCAIYNVTPSANEPEWAHSGLIEILNVMTARNVVREACLTVTAAARKFNEDLTIKDPALRQTLERSLVLLKEAFRERGDLRPA